MSTPSINQRIDALFTGQLNAEQQSRLLAEIAEDEQAQSYYQAHLAAERALVYGDVEAAGKSSHFENERLKSRILEATSEAESIGAAPIFGGFYRWIAALSVVVVVVIAALLMTRGKPGITEPPDEFTARGSEQANVGVRALRVSSKDGQAKVVAPKTASDRSLEFSIGDEMLLLYSNADAYPFVFVVGQQDGSAQPLWYFPAPGETGDAVRSVPIKPKAANEALGASIQLSVNHRVGRLRVIALFSKTPLSLDQVNKALTDDSLDKLPAARKTLTITIRK